MNTNTLHRDPPAQRRPRPRTGRIVAIVAGCLLLLPGLGLALGGGTLAIAQAAAADEAGYFAFTPDRLESPGVAVGTTDIWLDAADGEAPWLFDLLDVDVRLRVDGAGPTDDIFVGIARASDVERYLDGAAWSEVLELDESAPRYRQFAGREQVAPPAQQDFWVERASGSGTQELTWDARGGRWSVVVMNVDGSPVVAADVEIGARSGAVTPVAITLLVIGGLVVAASVVLIVVGARARRTPDETPMGTARPHEPDADTPTADTPTVVTSTADTPTADTPTVVTSTFPPPSGPLDQRDEHLVR